MGAKTRDLRARPAHRVVGRLLGRGLVAVGFLACAVSPSPGLQVAKNQRGWSPDGTRLAFFLPWNGDAADRDIFVVRRDGSELQALTCNHREDANPAWSPDGEWIAYFGRVGDWLQIQAVRWDGSGSRQLTHGTWHSHSPEWSPDGTELLFETNQDGVWELYRSPFPGWNPRRVTRTPDRDGRPAWFRDDEVVYYSDRDGDDELYLANLATGKITQITDNEAADYNPSWIGPDQIVFVSDRDGDDEIYRSAVSGGPAVQLTFNDANEWNPYASPDGSTISFYSDRDGMEGLYLMDTDGNDPHILVSAAQVEIARARCTRDKEGR